MRGVETGSPKCKTRFILRAIAVLGVNPKPLRGRLAKANAEFLSFKVEEWRGED